MKVLVVAAWEPELTRFRERLAASGATAELEIVVETLGVGVIEASIGMTRCAARHRPSLALLLGTCGAFDCTGAPAVGDVIAGSRIQLFDAGLSVGESELPAPMPVAVTLEFALHDALVGAGARSVQIANTLGITVDDVLAARIAASGPADVEHLEAFGFARACASAGIAGGVVLGVANAVGARGRAEWLANHTRVSARAADVAWEALAGLAAASLRTSTTAPWPERA